MSETVVVGGGLVGTLIALRLAESGHTVRVLDRDRPGREASIAAAGILAAQSEGARPGPAFELAFESLGLHAALDEELRATTGAGSGYVKVGALELANSDAHRESMVKTTAWQRDRGLAVDVYDATMLCLMAPGVNPRFAGALGFPDDAVVDPTALMAGALAAAAARGVRFEHGVSVLEVLAAGGRTTGVRTDQGVRGADTVVLCAGAWSALIGGGLADPRLVRPARGQIAEVTLHPVPFATILHAAGGYLVPRASGRVCIGSTMEDVGFERGTTVGGVRTLLDRAVEVVPALASAALNQTWSGFRPMTPDGLPLVGALGIDGLFVATGHHRSGIVLAPITATMVRDLIVHGRRHPHLDALDPLRFKGSSPA